MKTIVLEIHVPDGWSWDEESVLMDEDIVTGPVKVRATRQKRLDSVTQTFTSLRPDLGMTRPIVEVKGDLA